MLETPSLFGDTSKNPSSRAGGYSEEFEILWKAYPRKIGKRATYSKVGIKLRAGAEYDKLIAAAVNYAKWAKDGKKELAYLKHGATFYGPQDHWEEWAGGIPEGEQTPMPDFEDAPWNKGPDDMDYGMEVGDE